MASNSTLPSPMGTFTHEKYAKELQFIEEMTKNADQVQQNVLAEILTQNAETEYLKGFNPCGATNRDIFKSKIPVVTYEDLQPLIRRIADGDRSPILCAQPISEFTISTGTSGSEAKLIPTTKQELDRRKLLLALVKAVMNMYVKGLDKGKALYFLFTKSTRKTQAGILARFVFTSIIHTFFKTQSYNPYTSPYEAIDCADLFQSMYTQMLCGLYEREHVLRVGSTFASNLLRSIKFLQLNWQQLTHDIRTGSLNPKVTDPSIRECMTRILRPNPNLADFIVQECAKDNREGIIENLAKHKIS
ncbi:hypothetical protein DH2020_044781 [Rehmannia glutinosa]|uniref:Indole-3-acetic acid-amido synthetase n=1 Tax=Rehmannia glutinosa TaxID=99300 RepID=A0ABR0UGQ2_REHGL